MKKSKIRVILALVGVFVITVLIANVGVSAEAEAVAVDTAENIDFGEWIQQYFTAEHITILVQMITIIGIVLKVVNQTKQLANTHIITMDNISSNVQKVVREVSSKEFTDKVNEQVKPLIETVGKLENLVSTQTKMIALMQDNSPSAKIAVTDLLCGLGSYEMKETAKVVKTSIENEEQEKAVALENKKVKLGKIKKETVKSNTVIL